MLSRLGDGRMAAIHECLVVLVHGSLATTRSWRKVQARLALPPGAEVVSAGVPGWDEPPRRVEPDVPLDRLALAVARQLEPSGRPVVLVGFSNGGTIALHLALRPLWPITRLVLFDPNTIPLLPLAGHTDDFQTAATTIEEFSARVRAGDPSATRYMVDYVLGPGVYARLPEPARAHFQAYGPLNARDARAALVRRYHVDELKALSTPTVVVNGTESPRIFKQIGVSLVELVPGTERRMITDAGHQMLDTHPVEVADVIAAACFFDATRAD
jgi:pimeloyl-ACP methyl ester carboxylesterase